MHVTFYLKVMYTVSLDGQQIHTAENTDPRTFENVKVFTGDNFEQPTNAKYKNLVYENIPVGGKIIIF